MIRTSRSAGAKCTNIPKFKTRSHRRGKVASPDGLGNPTPTGSTVRHDTTLRSAGAPVWIRTGTRPAPTNTGFYLIGSEMENFVPCPGVLSTFICPPCPSITRFTIARPTPVPSSFVETNRSKILLSCSSGMP